MISLLHGARRCEKGYKHPSPNFVLFRFPSLAEECSQVNMAFSLGTLTCIMATLHAAMMIADGIEIVQEVTLTTFCCGGFPVPPLAATASLSHMGSHVKPPQGEVHQRGELVALLAHLPKAFQVNDEDIR